MTDGLLNSERISPINNVSHGFEHIALYLLRQLVAMGRIDGRFARSIERHSDDHVGAGNFHGHASGRSTEGNNSDESVRP